jgi:NADP-dependent 3-hydroxy acid dehydrogenase YdfG
VFVAEGAYVFITGRHETELTAAVTGIGKSITAIRADVFDSNDLDRMFLQIKNEKGTLDIVFANAGIAKYAQKVRSARSFISRFSMST